MTQRLKASQYRWETILAHGRRVINVRRAFQYFFAAPVY